MGCSINVAAYFFVAGLFVQFSMPATAIVYFDEVKVPFIEIEFRILHIVAVQSGTYAYGVPIIL